MKNLLLGTSNPAKIELLQAFLSSLPVAVLSPGNLGIHLEITEDGRTPAENALKKAREYYAAARVPTITTDAGLRIARFPPEKQPGLFVRRVPASKETPGDREILAYYMTELSNVGGESPGTWEVAIVLVLSPARVVTQTYPVEVLLKARPNPILLPGQPLSSLMTDPATGKYFSEMVYQERPDYPIILEFVKKHLDL